MTMPTAPRPTRLGFPVSLLGHGMSGMRAWSGEADDGHADADPAVALDRSVALGCTFFDTALAYGDGGVERDLGALLARHPEARLRAATKVLPRNRQWPARSTDRFPGVKYVDRQSSAGKVVSARSAPVREPSSNGTRAATLRRVEALRADLPPGADLAKVALRFAISHAAVTTTVIPGMRRVANVERNARRGRGPAACGRARRGPAPSVGSHAGRPLTRSASQLACVFACSMVCE